jgi:PAS domain S-box-containing protein
MRRAMIFQGDLWHESCSGKLGNRLKTITASIPEANLPGRSPYLFHFTPFVISNVIMSHHRKNQIESRRRHYESAAAVIFTHDLDGNLRFLNRQGEQLLGYSGEEARHMNIDEIVEPEVVRQLREQILNSAESSIGVVYEIEAIAKDGRRVPLEVSTCAVFREGQPVEIEGLAIPSTSLEEVPSMARGCFDPEFFYRIWLKS